jgi:hypothetical protein
VNRRLALLGAAALVLSSAATAGVAVAAPAASGVTHRNVRVCAAPAAGSAACHAIRHEFLDRHGKPTPPPKGDAGGYNAASLRDAYNVPSSTTHPTVAIIDAYHLPTALPDLNAYRAANSLPAVSASSTPFFKQVDQRGGTAYPAADTGWGQEIALDIEMVTAMCPNCNILLVEADSAYFSDLRAAVAYAASVTGVMAISNSYGGGETSPMAEYDQSAKNIIVTASTGDNGYGVSSPASFPSVTAVGGTSLVRTSNGFAETAWSGAGSGCARYTAKPAYQNGVDTGCSRRAVADVSAVADPNTGVAVYDSYNSPGWMVFGGTSASAPIIAGVFALDGNGGRTSDLYAAASTSFQDVTSGSNGRCGRTSPQLCNARSGWDGPTGLGTPNGTSAF